MTSENRRVLSVMNHDAVESSEQVPLHEEDPLITEEIYTFPSFSLIWWLMSWIQQLKFRAMLWLYHSDHPKHSHLLSNLAKLHFTRSQVRPPIPPMTDLETAIVHEREALAFRPHGHPHRHISVGNLAMSLSFRFNVSENRDDLEEAIKYARETVAIRPKTHPYFHIALSNLASSLFLQFHRARNVKDLDECLENEYAALELRPLGHSYRSISLSNIARYLHTRFFESNRMENLDKAIALQHEAVDDCPSNHPMKNVTHGELSQLLLCRFSYLSDIKDLHAAIDQGHAALASCPSNHPTYPSALGNLASLLHVRSIEGGTTDDLKKAIEHGHASLDLHPPGHPMRRPTLQLLAGLYNSRFYQAGDINDLHEAVKHGSASLNSHPPDSPSRIAAVGIVVSSLALRFIQLGRMEDLEDALEHARAALKQLPDGVPGHDLALQSVAGLLQARFDEFGRLDDINEAIELEHAVLDLHPVGHPGREQSLGTYAFSFTSRFTRFGNLDDLDKAIKYQRESLMLRPSGHRNRPLSLSNLATALGMRFDKVHETKDLDEAIEFEREALGLRPPGHPHRHYYSLDSLAKLLHQRFQSSGNRDDLEQSLKYSMEAYTTAEKNMDPLLPKISITLADLYKADGNIDLAFTLLNEASENTTSSLLNRFEAAIAWVKLGRNVDHASTSVAYDKALLLVQRSLFLRATVEMQHSLLSRDDVKFLASEATSWALRKGNLEGALQTFEQGRALFWSKIRRFREPLTDLRARYPDKADEFEDLSSRLEHLATAKSGSTVADSRTIDSLKLLGDNEPSLPPGFKQSLTAAAAARSATMVKQNLNLKLANKTQDQSAAAFDQQIKEQRLLAERWNDMLSEIQALGPKFNNFLGPVPVDELKTAAKYGPVILLNHAELFIDALIILPNGEISHIPLTDTAPELLGSLSSQMDRIRSRDTANSEPRDPSLRLKPKINRPVISDSDDLESLTMLRTLWEIVVEPVVKALLRMGRKENSRIWWCPGGKLSQFPIHAAGPYKDGEKNLYDYFISSYTSTLSSLIAARQSQSNSTQESASVQTSASMPESATGKVLAIGQSTSLPKVDDELRVLEEIFAEKATILKNDKADPQSVLAKLPVHPWAHFSCHGARGTPQEPLSSYFELHGAQLSLLEILETRLSNAELAFLAACHSAAGEPETPDEALSLAVTLQFCGFPRVIGTLWEMTDDDGPPLVEKFYGHILQNGIEDSAVALNLAVKSLQHNVEGAHPRRWATFIHIGV
ncbi:CHAT domain-containing protein [Rhodocollybia butyracea]|uniref:CHAT domain-containing protein n=1 Tax=Rhodocollybia butyracea TaxID=206335 RepID=A0A9P5PJY6_9AGAR|nr:CHAT domain-containing protein [Rhodocollybia butyracea]